ncbi:MAG: DUF374 domain-containing protein [Elusimicrobiota bacterium]|jgi:ADP-heptose:LPS heptosyltransferase/lysophospholipid acyltransferase (LPLAT)-like uncharacterized protein|nr:DUF374 domain-containing protein [Elusimicrobiota bacterium]
MIETLLTKTVLLIDKTLRKKYLNDTPRFLQPAIYPFWHGNEFAMLMSNQNNNIVIMVSLSKDGEILSQLLNNLGYITVRGSSTRGAQRALIEIIRYGRKNYSLAFAADGPKGPYHKLKAGVVYAAQKSGLPIVPICCSAQRNFLLKKTWDKERIPLPFSKTIQIWGAPIYIGEKDNIEEKTRLVENEVNKLFDLADNYYWKDDIVKYLDLHPAPKILIVQPSRIGDIIFALPSLASIKKKYPHARISWIVDERCAEILEGNPLLENIFIWNRKKRSLFYYRNLKKELRAQKFDLSIDFHGLAKSAMLVFLAKAKYKIASSSTNGMREFSWLISKQIKNPNPAAHCIERHLSVVKYLNCDEILEYPIAVSDADFESVKKKLIHHCESFSRHCGQDPQSPSFASKTLSGEIAGQARNDENERNQSYNDEREQSCNSANSVNLDKIIALHLGGGWISRRWAIDKFASLAQKLRKDLGASIVIIGGKEGGSSEKGLNEEFISLAKDIEICDMTGQFNLKELCAFFKLCRLFIGNEAGPMHIAAALNIPSIAILGPTNAKRTGPYKGQTQIIQHTVSCQPCRNRNCKNPICMQKIEVEEVFEAAKQKWLIPSSCR